MDRELTSSPDQNFFSIEQVSLRLPEQAVTMQRDVRLVDKEVASSRVVRVYKKLPLHYHTHSDENVFIVRGRAIFQLENEIRQVQAGMFIQFPRGAVHGILELLEEPFVTLTIDTPRRPLTDVTFLDTSDGGSGEFGGE